MKYGMTIVLGLLISACSLADLPMFSASQNCTSTYDCSPGDVCHFGECVNPGGDAGSVYLVLEPPPYSGIPAQEDIAGLRQAIPGAFHLVSVQTAPRIQGTVRVPSGEPRTGTLSIQGQKQITGLPNTQTALVGPEGFNIDLLPDNYTFRFIPENSEQRPPVSWGTIEISEIDMDALDLLYPEDAGLVNARGTLLYTSYPARPVIGAVVQGEYENAAGDTAYSSPSVTDEQGQYNIAFPGQVTEYRLKVSPGDNYFIPETVVSNLQASADEEVNLNLAPTPQSFQVLTTDTSGQLVPETTLYFRGIVQEYASELASFDFALQTGLDAEATVSLLPGYYTVTAVPPRSSDASVSVQTICIAGADLEESLCYVSDVESGETLALNLGTKTTLSGRVISGSGDAVPGSRVTLHTYFNGQRLDAEVNTDGKGFFSLRIDQVPDPEQIYTLTIRPASQLALPLHQETFTLASYAPDTVVTLPKTSLFAGRLSSETGLSVENVAISVYSVDRNTDGPVLIGVGTSTMNGEFLIPLPAQE